MNENKQYTIIKPDPTLKNNLMAFGFMCGKGWYPLIIELLDKLQAIEDRDQKGLEVLEVKEKFGTLRVYTSYATDEIFDLINKYEKKSETTCEVCGKDGTLYSDHGRLKTRCEEHRSG